MRKLLLILPTLLLCSALAAQTAASFTSYSKPCGSAKPLAVTGVPKIGGSFSVDGIITPMLCTRKFCGCNVGKCNSCQGTILVMGVKKINVQLGTCFLRTDPLALIPGTGKLVFNVPNNAALFSFRFQMQRADIAMDEMIDSNCKTSYLPTAVNAFSDAVEGYVGF